MLETLLALLKVDTQCPEIMLEEDGELGLDYYAGKFWISIGSTGKVNWAILNGSHGTDLDEFVKLLEAHRG